MDDDWDLSSVVRSCAAFKSDKLDTGSSGSGGAATASEAASTDLPVQNTEADENPLACLANLRFEDEDDPFGFPNLVLPKSEGTNELYQCCKPFVPTDATVSSTAIVPEASQQMEPSYYQLLSPRPSPPPRPQFVSTTTVCSPPPPVMPPQFQAAPAPPMPFPSMRIPASRARRSKKNQQKKTVRHVPEEQLNQDQWAWRKYGQKPIKGSPHPRNYYRCSSSKGCAARKQVERSTGDPTIFVVTYTGEHTHPRPSSRSSLAGTSRSRYANIAPRPSHQDALPPSTPPLTSAATPPEDSADAIDEDEDDDDGDEEDEGAQQIRDAALNEMGSRSGYGGASSSGSFGTDDRGRDESKGESSHWVSSSSAASGGAAAEGG